MANTLAPFGFRPIGHRDGSAPTHGLERYFTNSSDVNPFFTGDAVAMSTTALGIICPSSMGAGEIVGVFAGCEYYNPTVNRQTWSPYWPGSVSSSSPVTCYVISDPEMMFIVQGSSAGAVPSQYVGGNCSISVLASNLSSGGNTTTGQSVMAITGGSTLQSLSTCPFRIVDMYSNWALPGINGTDNTAAGNIVVVAPNNWTRKSLTGVAS